MDRSALSGRRISSSDLSASSRLRIVRRPSFDGDGTRLVVGYNQWLRRKISSDN